LSGGAILLIGVGFVALLWIVTALRRHSLRTYLLAVGAQTRGSASLVRRRGRRTPSIVVKYTDNNGVEHRARKMIVSAGDDELVRKPAMVVYHPDRTSRDDYVLLGFGARPTRWFRVSFVRDADG
jgi:hypothetical protein